MNMLATAIAGGLVVLALTGCTTAVEAEPSPSRSAPVAAPLEVGAAIEDGAVLTETQRAFTLRDGSTVLVDVGLPLPAAVLADIAQPLLAMTTANDFGQLSTYADRFTETTGKHIVIVFAIYGSATLDGPLNWAWGVKNTDLGPWSSPLRDDAIARANAWVAAQENPASFEVVVSDSP